MWGLDCYFSSPPGESRCSPTNTPVFSPSSFILPSFVWFYIFFSTGQVLLSILSWCSACTSVSEGVFLMYPCREIYSIRIHLLLHHVVLPPSFSFLFFWELDTKYWDIQKELHRQGKLESDPTCPGEGTLQTDTWHRDSL